MCDDTTYTTLTLTIVRLILHFSQQTLIKSRLKKTKKYRCNLRGSITSWPCAVIPLDYSKDDHCSSNKRGTHGAFFDHGKGMMSALMMMPVSSHGCLCQFPPLEYSEKIFASLV